MQQRDDSWHLIRWHSSRICLEGLLVFAWELVRASCVWEVFGGAAGCGERSSGWAGTHLNARNSPLETVSPSLWLFFTAGWLAWQIENQIENPKTNLIMRHSLIYWPPPPFLTKIYKIQDFDTKTHYFTFFLTKGWTFWHRYCRWWWGQICWPNKHVNLSKIYFTAKQSTTLQNSEVRKCSFRIISSHRAWCFIHQILNKLVRWRNLFIQGDGTWMASTQLCEQIGRLVRSIEICYDINVMRSAQVIQVIQYMFSKI